MMTALGSSFITFDLSEPSGAVPLLIWEFYNDPNMVNMVWSSALFLMLLVLTLNIISRSLAAGYKNGKRK